MNKPTVSLLMSLLVLIFAACNGEDFKDTSHLHEFGVSDTIVTIAEARADLTQLLSDLEVAKGRSGVSKSIESAYTTGFHKNISRAGGSDFDVHVFNFANNGGFAVMSTDRRYPSLIALADSGSFEESANNPGAAIFFSIYDPRPADTTLIITNGERYGPWRTTVYGGNGLCKVKWGQSYPYNGQCPTIDGNRTLTNCVATATAQLMSAYQYPYYAYGISFDWDAITTYPHLWQCNNEAINSVQSLMAKLGSKDNLDVMYGVDISSSYLSKASRTLENFGYASGGSYENYSSMKVNNELKKGYPVLVRGSLAENGDGGHAWLLHGLLIRTREVTRYRTEFGETKVEKDFERQVCVLCNWGWDGDSDGYYTEDAFTPKKGAVVEEPSFPSSVKQPYEFKYVIKALTGIRK